jgi:acetyl-CoA acyltransferase
VLRNTGLWGIPIVNVENACASSGTALHLAWQAVAAGAYDRVLVVGLEKLYDQDRRESFRALSASMDLEELHVRFGPDAAAERSVFMDLYVERARDRIEMALVSVKNRRHGARNPFAQFRAEVSVEACSVHDASPGRWRSRCARRFPTARPRSS